MPFTSAQVLHWVPHPRLPEGEKLFEKRWIALWVVSMGILLIALDVTIVGVVGPSLSVGLNATAAQIQWSFDAYTVMMGGFVVLCGGLAERFGRKGGVQLGMLIFAIGSLLAAFAPSVWILLAGRAISGLGAAFVFPAGLSIISNLFPPDERPRAIAIFAAISACGLAAGPFVGGFLIEWFWWGAAFLVVVPVAILAILAMAIVVPPSRQEMKGPVDFLGAFLSVFGLGGIVFSLIEGSERGWGDSMVLLSLAIGILSTGAFIFWELHTDGPLFDLRVLKNEEVIAGALGMFLVYFTLCSLLLILPQYLSYVLNFSADQTGMTMIPFGIGLLFLAPRSSKLIERHGLRAVLVFSLSMMFAGLCVLGLLPVWGGLGNVVLGAVVFSVGFGLTVAPATSAIMVAVPKEKAGDGSAVNMVSRQIGGSVGVAVSGSLAAVMYRKGLSLSSFDLTAEQTQLVELSLSGADTIEKALDPAAAARLDKMADASMVVGTAWAMGMMAVVTAVVTVIAFFALRKKGPAAG